MERPAAAAALDDPKAGTRESRPAEPARCRGRSRRAVRRRQGGHGRRARAGHAEAAAGLGARPNPAGRGCGASRSPGRASCPGAARRSGPHPGHAARTGASVTAQAPAAAGPGTGTELLIDTPDDSGGSCRRRPDPGPRRYQPTADDRRQGLAPTSGDPARLVHRGAVPSIHHVTPTPCPSPPVPPLPAASAQVASTGKIARALRAFRLPRCARQTNGTTGQEAPQSRERNGR